MFNKVVKGCVNDKLDNRVLGREVITGIAIAIEEEKGVEHKKVRKEYQHVLGTQIYKQVM